MLSIYYLFWILQHSCIVKIICFLSYISGSDFSLGFWLLSLFCHSILDDLLQVLPNSLWNKADRKKKEKKKNNKTVTSENLEIKGSSRSYKLHQADVARAWSSGSRPVSALAPPNTYVLPSAQDDGFPDTRNRQRKQRWICSRSSVSLIS